MTLQIRQLGLPTVQQLSGRLGLPTVQQLSGLGATPLEALTPVEHLLDFGAAGAGLLSIGAAALGHKELAHGAAWAGLFGGMAAIAVAARRMIQTHSLVQQAGGDPSAMIVSINLSNAAAFAGTLFGGGALGASALGFFLAGQ